ncbi:DNA mismatch repair protein MSH5-like [Argentina anserina]|uniref:DNA mismatch repair protein MSH5-like n=1 Tax=Argentina anserina TaxID=57926 RepID=UPI00217628B9|nr:DNA mismatch repair protein MSH5-like [Potentilla anserina]
MLRFQRWNMRDFLSGKGKNVPCIVHTHQIGYMMCIFEEKLDETKLETLQDFEFATEKQKDSFIILQRLENWIIFWEISIIKY